MNEIAFVVDVLTRWVLTGRDFEALLAEAISAAQLKPDDAKRIAAGARSDLARLLEADQAYLRRLRGNPERLSNEIAGILRW